MLELEKKYRGLLVCHFCENNTPDENCKISKTIYIETSRSYFPSKVQYSYLDIDIPRCKNCLTIHSSGSEIFWMTLFCGIIVGSLIGLAVDEHYIVGGIIGGLIGWIVGALMGRNLTNKEGIKNVSNSTLKKHPLLLQRLNEGWSFSKPSA